VPVYQQLAESALQVSANLELAQCCKAEALQKLKQHAEVLQFCERCAVRRDLAISGVNGRVTKGRWTLARPPPPELCAVLLSRDMARLYCSSRRCVVRVAAICVYMYIFAMFICS
jgi:hypothetical protein